MTAKPILGRLEHLTFKGNLKQSRYGWLRLTPAYSVHLVADLIEKHGAAGPVLDPFCGTGTTALVCAERGIECATTDINPFLVWLAAAKSAHYTAADIHAFDVLVADVATAGRRADAGTNWHPPLHQIEKWWDGETLRVLAAMAARIAKESDAPATNLARVAFSRVMIGCANVDFGHQSMSFKKPSAKQPALDLSAPARELVTAWQSTCQRLVTEAASPVTTTPNVVLCDARDLRSRLPANHFECVITSPPYPNRMSYIRELRPYMYWLGYLSDGRQAGELDWKAIGGTWGCATSNVAKWTPPNGDAVPFDGFDAIVKNISATSDVLGRYVSKYFHDMIVHVRQLFDVVRPGGSVHYIVGNSKFYDTMLPVELIFAALFRNAGFVAESVETIRKRTSKKELFEFVVSARKPLH